MRYLWLSGLAAAFAGLVWARLAPASGLRQPLFLIGAGLSFTIAALAGYFLKKHASPRKWKALASALCGPAAVIARLALLFRGPPPKEGPELIVLWKTFAVSFQYTAAAVALLFGMAALWDVINRPQSPSDKKNEPASDTPILVLACLGITASLYSLAPATAAMGLGVNHWTFLLMLGVAVVVFGAVALLDRFLRTTKRQKSRAKSTHRKKAQ